jgi:hypothetical protein
VYVVVKGKIINYQSFFRTLTQDTLLIPHNADIHDESAFKTEPAATLLQPAYFRLFLAAVQADFAPSDNLYITR